MKGLFCLIVAMIVAISVLAPAPAVSAPGCSGAKEAASCSGDREARTPVRTALKATREAARNVGRAVLTRPARSECSGAAKSGCSG